jgi:hypothetical protein
MSRRTAFPNCNKTRTAPTTIGTASKFHQTIAILSLPALIPSAAMQHRVSMQGDILLASNLEFGSNSTNFHYARQYNKKINPRYNRPAYKQWLLQLRAEKKRAREIKMMI